MNKRNTRHLSYRPFVQKLSLSVATALVTFCASVAIAAAASPTAAPVQLTPAELTQVGTRGGDGGCYNSYDARNYLYGSNPANNFKMVATLDGKPLAPIGGGYEIYSTVNYHSKLVLTETAVRANDYFVKDGKHVSSIRFVGEGPKNVSSPAYCLDYYPYMTKNYTYTFTTLQSVTTDVLADAVDHDNARSELKITKVSTENGGSAQIVALPNGRNGVKFTPGSGPTAGTYYVYFTIADPLGKTGDGQITVNYNL